MRVYKKTSIGIRNIRFINTNLFILLIEINRNFKSVPFVILKYHFVHVRFFHCQKEAASFAGGLFPDICK